MELFDNKKDVLEKIDLTSELGNRTVLTENEAKNISAGYSVVSDPIYSLTEKEAKIISSVGYTLTKTKSGNYRIKDENGKMASPSDVAVICKVIDKASTNKGGRTFWDWLSGN